MTVFSMLSKYHFTSVSGSVNISISNSGRLLRNVSRHAVMCYGRVTDIITDHSRGGIRLIPPRVDACVAKINY